MTKLKERMSEMILRYDETIVYKVYGICKSCNDKLKFKKIIFKFFTDNLYKYHCSNCDKVYVFNRMFPYLSCRDFDPEKLCFSKKESIEMLKRHTD